MPILLWFMLGLIARCIQQVDDFLRLVEILQSVVILYTTGRRLHTDESLKPVVTGVEEDVDRYVYSE